jgi:hypothetical protein
MRSRPHAIILYAFDLQTFDINRYQSIEPSLSS